MKWFEENKERFQIELTLLRRNYPNARIVIDNGEVIIFKKVLGKFQNYLIKITYPESFPYSSPSAYPVTPKIHGAPHQYSDGKLCLHNSSEVGCQTSGKIVCDWVVRWIKAYEVWLASGKRNFPEKNVEGQWIQLR